MAGLPGTSLDAGTRLLIEEYGISNFILFSRNTDKGPQALADLCGEIKAVCQKEDMEPLISVDQEGGPVKRLAPPLFPDIPSARDVVSSPDPKDAAAQLAAKTAELLNRAGINMNLAPVLDLCLEAEENVLKGRCFSKEPGLVADLGRIYIQELQQKGILAAAKHFPGIGRVKLDPHFERPQVTASIPELATDIIPFQEAMKAGTAALMTSHVVYQKMDRIQPATFSRRIAHDLLRNSLDFRGLLLSDDLEMKGITKHCHIGQAAVKAFTAGHDLLLVCSHQKDVLECMKSLKYALEEGLISTDRVGISLARRHGALKLTDPAG